MSDINTGGSAFPRPGDFYPQRGMTLRDYFAAKAMSAIVTCGDDVADDIASKAYIIADAMIKARDQ